MLFEHPLGASTCAPLIANGTPCALTVVASRCVVYSIQEAIVGNIEMIGSSMINKFI